MLNYLFWAFAGYLLAGLILFVFLDRDETEEHVPCGEFPSGISLRLIRVITLIVALFFWLPALVHAIVSKGDS